MRIIAHRGLPGPGRPENTAAAVRAAYDEAGADSVEVDLRLSADGVLVACHDADLVRLAGVPLSVVCCAWPELRDGAAAGGVALADFADVLDAAETRSLVLELKAPPPGVDRVRRTAEALVVGLLTRRRAGFEDDITVSSFAPQLLDAVHGARPRNLQVRTALLGRPLARPTGLLRQALAAGYDEIHPHVLSAMSDPDALHAAHRTGVAVVPWAVNRASELRRLARAGVDGVITDLPVMARDERDSRAATH